MGRDGKVAEGGNPRKRATQLPDDWQPNEQHRDYATQERVDLEFQAAKFRDHARANGKTQKDWDATFRNWLRTAVEWRKDSGPVQPARSLQRATEIEQPPDGLSDAEYAQWYAEQQQRRRA
jgi:hypothetical protein